MNNTQRNKLIEEKCRALVANAEPVIQKEMEEQWADTYVECVNSLQLINELKEILGYSKPEGKLEQIEIKF
jgi:hypothetical protein